MKTIYLYSNDGKSVLCVFASLREGKNNGLL